MHYQRATKLILLYVYTDLGSAFNTISHDFFLKSLECYGVIESVIEWLSSYLSMRIQSVKMYGFESYIYIAVSGVPQTPRYQS